MPPPPSEILGFSIGFFLGSFPIFETPETSGFLSGYKFDDRIPALLWHPINLMIHLNNSITETPHPPLPTTF